jgi:protein O-GlcNAc transferase
MELQNALSLLLKERTKDAWRALTDIQQTLDIPPVAHNKALCLELESRFEEAAELYRDTARRFPDYVRSYVGLANCQRHMKLFGESLNTLLEAVDMFPGYPQLYFLLSAAYRRANEIDLACRFLVSGCMAAKDMAAIDTEHFVMAYYDDFCGSLYVMRRGAATLLDLLYSDSLEEALILDMHRFLGVSGTVEDSTHALEKRLGGPPLKVGYISRSFLDGSVASVVLPILRHHTPKVELYCYHLGSTDDDAVTVTVRQLSHFRSCPKDSVAKVQKLVRKDALDVLISLDGHTTGNIMRAMEHRLAPIQLDLFGYPCSTGVPSIDYKLADAFTDPPGAEALYTETLLRLPGCFLVWEPRVKGFKPPAGYTPGTPVRLLSPNNYKKLSPTTIAMFRDILMSTENTVLCFKSSLHNGAEDVSSFFAAHFEGLEDRIRHLDYSPTPKGHYHTLASHDIVLDTFPYNGTITTLESLYCGVPVVSLAGKTHRARVGGSILNAIGHPELVATTKEQYVATVSRLAADAEALQTYHATLHDDMKKSPIMKYDAYIGLYESMLWSLWKTPSVGYASKAME